MEELKKVIERKLKHADKRAKEIRELQGDNPGKTHTYHGGRELGMWEGRVSAWQDTIDEMEAEENSKDMGRYAVGVCPHDEDVKVKIVTAENEIVAMVKAVGNEADWGISNGKPPFSTVDEGITFYLQGDLAVSKPVKI